MKFILHLEDGSDGILALRAAHFLIRDDHSECVYGFENGRKIYVRRNKASISAYEEPTPNNGAMT